MNYKYEESKTGSGRKQIVVIDGKEWYCPSHELMNEQIVSVRGFKRGSRIYSTELTSDTKKPWGYGTVLSCYRIGFTERMCIAYDCRVRDNDRQGEPVKGCHKLV